MSEEKRFSVSPVPIRLLCTNNEIPTQAGAKPRWPVTMLGQPVTWLPTVGVSWQSGSYTVSVFLNTYCEIDQPEKEKIAQIPLAYFLGHLRRVQLKDVHIHRQPYSGWGVQVMLPHLPVGTPATCGRLLSGGTIPAGSCIGHWVNICRKWLMCLMFRLIRKVKIVGLFFPSKKCNANQLSH